MANKITTLVDISNNDQLFPRTKASAVADDAGNSLENLLIYQDNGVEELTDPTIVSSLVEASSMSNNGYFIYDDGTNVYKMKGSTLRNSILLTSSLSEGSSISNSDYFIYNNGTNVYKVKASTLKKAFSPKPFGTDIWYPSHFVTAWGILFYIPVNTNLYTVRTSKVLIYISATGAWVDITNVGTHAYGEYGSVVVCSIYGADIETAIGGTVPNRCGQNPLLNLTISATDK